MSMPGERIPPVERFRLAVCHAFPEQPQMTDAVVGTCIRAAWRQLAALLDMPVARFARALAGQMGLVVADSLEVSPRVLNLLPAAGMRKYPCLPLRWRGDELEVALANPWDEGLTRFVHFATSARVQVLLAPPEEIDEAIRNAFASLSHGSSERVGVIMPGEADDGADVEQLALRLLHEAAGLGASDLHVQPFLGGGMVRARIDGMLRRMTLLPEPVYRQLCRRFKAGAGVDPDTDRMPQDGRMSLHICGHDIELRLSTLPGRGGERLVIRFLGQNRSFHLEHSGFAIAEVHRLRRLIQCPSGLILLTGPGSCGKTTTLYSLLDELNAPHRNIITVENPLEYDLPGLSQIDISEGAGLTFARVLRSALSQDPDVLVVGGIDDRDTAEIACQGALAGSLVLSTLPANDAFGAIPRLLDLGVRPSVLADALVGVVALRLCRHLCGHCRVPVAEDDMHPQERAFRAMTGMAPLYRPMGCEQCGYSGFHGRLPVTGILEPSAALRQAIATNRLHEYASQQCGCPSAGSLSGSAVRHIVAGETSVGESVRVIGSRFWSDLAEEYLTRIPEYAFLSGEREGGGQAPGVLIAGLGGAEEERIAAELELAGFCVFRARTEVAARDQVQAHMDIVCVVAGCDDGPGNGDWSESVQRVRVDLPTVMLLPADRPGLADVLLADDPMIICVNRPVSPMTVTRLVRRVLSSAREGLAGMTFADLRAGGDGCEPMG